MTSLRRALTALAASALLACGSPEAPAPPNLLVLVLDDMGLELGCYGDAHATTPNLDGLARDGLRFERAYACAPTCSPSRAALLTGIAPHTNGHWGFPNYSRLHPSVRTLPAYLRDAGYRTGLIGKLQVGGAEDQFPFDVFLSTAKRDTRRKERRSNTFLQGLLDEFFSGLDDEPFLLMVNVNAAHANKPGQWVDQEWDEPHDPARVTLSPWCPPTPEMRANVAGMYDAYSAADEQVGMVLQALAERGLDGSTCVVVTSDHGPALPAGKTTLYEGGVRVPLVVRWPGVVEPGRASPALVVNTDVLPTLLEAVGIDVPAPVQGRSLLGLLRGAEREVRDAVFLENTGALGNAYYPQRAVRGERFKLIRNLRPDVEFRNNALRGWGVDLVEAWHDDPAARSLLTRLVRRPPEELYDLDADPHEQVDLASDPAHAEELERLRARLEEWMRATDDPWVVLLDGAETDPLEPTETVDGPFEPRWLDREVERRTGRAPGG